MKMIEMIKLVNQIGYINHGKLYGLVKNHITNTVIEKNDPIAVTLKNSFGFECVITSAVSEMRSSSACDSLNKKLVLLSRCDDVSDVCDLIELRLLECGGLGGLPSGIST